MTRYRLKIIGWRAGGLEGREDEEERRADAIEARLALGYDLGRGLLMGQLLPVRNDVPSGETIGPRLESAATKLRRSEKARAQAKRREDERWTRYQMKRAAGEGSIDFNHYMLRRR